MLRPEGGGVNLTPAWTLAAQQSESVSDVALRDPVPAERTTFERSHLAARETARNTET